MRRSLGFGVWSSEFGVRGSGCGGCLWVLAAWALGAVGGVSAVAAAEKLPSAASWQVPKVEDVQAEAFAVLDERGADDATRQKAKALWDAKPDGGGPGDLVERVARSIALVDENARKLVELCSKPRSEPVLASQDWLGDPKIEPFVAHNLRLYYGRWLVQEKLYDEAKEQLAGLRPEDVVDPAALLFHQAVVSHRLLERESGLAAIARLQKGLDEHQEAPRRYAAVARLMQYDLQDLKLDSLDHIGRRMEDIGRRLDLGRSGKKVREVEDGVIASLDKLIKRMEDQQQQQQQAGANARNTQPSNPAQDSRIMETKGPGQVAKKNIGQQSGWGDLPPKQREEALQQIGREFPPHYRDVVEQYFRKLAGEGSKSQSPQPR